MRNIFYSFIVLATLFTTSCSKTRTYVERNLTTNFEIPAGLNTIESFYFNVPDVYLFYNETIQNNGLSSLQKYEVSGSKALLKSRISGLDFSIIEKISVFAIEKNNPNNRTEIFYNEAIPFQNISELKLLSAISDMSPYIHDNKIDLQVRILFRGFIGFTQKVDLDFGYLIYTN